MVDYVGGTRWMVALVLAGTISTGCARSEQCERGMCGEPNGTSGTGGFTIEGQVVDQGMSGLDGVNVRAILGETGVISAFTDSDGMVSLEVERTGDYRLCAVGAISDSLPRRFVSTNCQAGNDEVTVSTDSNDPAFSEVSITSGYYMEITNAPLDFAEPEGNPIPAFDVSYHVWNRTGVGQTRTFIALGIEGDAQFAHEIANAGPFDNQTAAAMGVAMDVALTAAPGTIFARLLPVDTAMEAMTLYESGFLTNAMQTNYVAIGTVTTP